MSKKEERDNFWISVGPESGYLGTIAEETARKNDGGISPDGKRLGWHNACDCPPTHYQPEGKGNCDCGDDCNCTNVRKDCDCTDTHQNAKHAHKDRDCDKGCDCAPQDACNYCTGGVLTQDNALEYGGAQVGYIPMFGADCDCGILPLPGMIPAEDIGPERQNKWENE